MSKKIILDKETCEKIALNITNKKETFKSISQKMNISPNVIRRNIREYNIKVIVSNKKKNIKLKDVYTAFALYKDKGYSLSEIAKQFKISRPTLMKQFKKYDLNLKEINRYRSHINLKLNKNIFEKIDTPEKAYWLGFLLADGYIDKQYQHLEIGLQKRDFKHLEKFNNFINSSIPIKLKGGNNSCKIIITSVNICNDLKKHGVENNKSLTCRLNKNILKNKKLKYHYLRGFLDGDGCIYLNKNKKITTSFVGNNEIIKDIKENIPEFHNMKIQHKKHSNAYSIAISHKKSISFLSKIYKNSTICLYRKYNKFAVYNESNSSML